MAELTWDETGQRFYETGVDHGVLYIPDNQGVYGKGVPWNGLTTVTESPSGAEANAQYADNIKYLNLFSAEEFGATVEAFTYPDEFMQFDGLATPSPGVAIGQQSRKTFGLSYRSRIGNDISGDDFGYKLHLLYGCQASPSERAYQTINDSPAAIAFSWAVTTTPVPAGSDLKPTALITVSSNVVDEAALMALEDILYGSSGEAKLPLPEEVIALFPNGAAVTGASAGTPGSWTPGGSTPPASVSALQSASPAVVAAPTTAWTTGQYVQTGTAGAPGQAHWSGSAWVAGPA